MSTRHKRSQTELIHDFLTTVKKTISKMDVLYATKTSFNLSKRYLNALVDSDLIKRTEVSENKFVYEITVFGNMWLEKYADLVSIFNHQEKL